MKINLSYKIKLAPLNEGVIAMNTDIARAHKVVGVFGPSGAGKTTMLKIMAGLVPQAQCTLALEDKELLSPEHKPSSLPAADSQPAVLGNTHSQDVSEYVNTSGSQNPCVYIGSDSPLFEHLSVSANLKLVTLHSQSRAANSLSIKRVTELCDIHALLEKYPVQLSSGQQQRVCLARGLLSGKKILLLDEAFSALDWRMRKVMHLVLQQLVVNEGYRAIMVSHSLKELGLCATQVLSINNGALVSQLPTKEVLARHVTQAVDENEGPFSVINAKFSHIEPSDPSLQVWTLAPIDLSASPNNFYVKSNSPQSKLSSATLHALLHPKADETRSFIVNANQLSVSRHANNETSMVNCFAVCIDKIEEKNGGILLTARCQHYILYATITLKSRLSLRIEVGQKMYFVCKALR